MRELEVQLSVSKPATKHVSRCSKLVNAMSNSRQVFSCRLPAANGEVAGGGILTTSTPHHLHLGRAPLAPKNTKRQKQSPAVSACRLLPTAYYPSTAIATLFTQFLPLSPHNFPQPLPEHPLGLQNPVLEVTFHSSGRPAVLVHAAGVEAKTLFIQIRF